MGVTIGIDSLSSTIQQYMNELEIKADKSLDMAGKMAAEKGAQTLKGTSPKRKKSGGTPGRYANGWRVKADGGAAGHLYIIHNSTNASLTHLLEKGHALRQGGRSPAIVHIQPVEQAAIRDFEDNIRRFMNI